MQKPAMIMMITSGRRRVRSLLEMDASTTPTFHKFNFLSTIEKEEESKYDLSTQSNEMVLGFIKLIRCKISYSKTFIQLQCILFTNLIR